MELSDFRVLGTILGFTPWDYISLIKSKKVDLEEIDIMTNLLKMVIKQRVDGAYVNVSVASYQLEHVLKKPGVLVFNPNLPHTIDSYRLSSIKHPKIIAAFNKFLSSEHEKISLLKQEYNVEDVLNDKKHQIAKKSQVMEGKSMIDDAKLLIDGIKIQRKPLIIEGSRGYYVELLQKKLKSKKFYKGPVDGQFNHMLTNAVLILQKQNKLIQDGMVGPKTWKVVMTN